jgi:hypothetical protein
MDIWEANSQSQAFTTHPCASTGQTQCEGSDCGDNITGERLSFFLYFPLFLSFFSFSLCWILF